MNVAKAIFVQNNACMTLLVEKSSQKIGGYIFIYFKSAQSTNWATMRPICGRCYDHNFLRFSAKKIGVFLKNQSCDQNFA
jgi:hypothetical protein